MGRIDPKVAAGGLGNGVAYIVWVLLAVFVDQIRQLDPEVLVGLAVASGGVLQTALGYWIPNAASPIKGDGVMPAARGDVA